MEGAHVHAPSGGYTVNQKSEQAREREREKRLRKHTTEPCKRDLDKRHVKETYERDR